MTDIYYGNGVWNTEDQAEEGAIELRGFMMRAYNARLDRNKEGETYQFMPPAYNPTRGTIEDLLETFWQLKESGQISEGYFMAKWNLLTQDRGPDELRKAIDRVATTNTVDVNRMYNTYNNTSFNKKHNILLVAHSQGNLFGNKIYELLSDAQKKKFRMVSVGTPANHVMKPDQTAPYVTAKDDFVINRVSGALTGNVDGFGHTFIGTYLGSSFEARTQIALYVKNAYDVLMQTTSCTEYDYVFFRVYETDNLKVVAKQSNIFINDIIGEVNIEYTITDTIKNNAYYCGDDYPSYYFHPSLDLQLDYMIWNVSPFFSKSELESNKGATLKYQFGNKCASISLSGQVYDLALSALE